ncbi:hypothetical protein ACH5RR_011799 [Cinchona calisaya]|uniref:BZIP domain-containing protein n=1 Tax=Cinchona calisaya TaxID=153742 RepID=A0ABD3A6I4_9GENT
MSSSSGNSSGANTQIQDSGSDEDLRQIMDTRKRKRMISNRESARRSRMRKQKHLDEMIAQVSLLRNENNQMVTNLNVTTQIFLNIEAENSVLRAQMAELTHRLQSLNDIVNCLNATNAAPFVVESEDLFFNDQMISGFGDHDFLNPWNLLNVNQPIMASADAFMY